MSCGCDRSVYGRFFNKRFARRVARKYRKRGLDATSQRIADFVAAHGLEGATVLEAAGGQDALRLAAADCFDVAVIELALPDVCDEGLITLLAAVARSGVLVTMSASPRQDQARAIIAGAARFYARPVDWDELVRYLEWISPGGSAPSGTRPRTPAQ